MIQRIAWGRGILAAIATVATGGASAPDHSLQVAVIAAVASVAVGFGAQPFTEWVRRRLTHPEPAHPEETRDLNDQLLAEAKRQARMIAALQATVADQAQQIVQLRQRRRRSSS